MVEVSKPCLWMVIPCYNEEEVLSITAPLFLGELQELIQKNKIAENSKILLIDDGSRDATWQIISRMAKENEHFCGIQQSRNRGHQNAVLAGLMEAKDRCDITISIDCDGQDDIHAMEDMIDAYADGCEIVYGVRSNRSTDTFWKRFTAQSYYKFLNALGGNVVYNHADYRLVSNRVLQEFSHFEEVNLFLRGMFPLVGFKSTSVYYERHERMAGKSHYPLSKMLALAFDGITSLSNKPNPYDFHGGNFGFPAGIYRHYLGGDCPYDRTDGSRLGKYGLHGVFYRRHPAYLYGSTGGIHR